jgi:sec-independent protein translocase protein TatA
MGLDNPIHIAFLLVIVLVVFGAKRLPEMGRSLGSGMREFKEALSTQSTSVALSEPKLDQASVGPPAVGVAVAEDRAPAE